MIIGGILGFIPILLIAYMNKKNKNLFELINSIFGKVLSKVINFIIVITLIFTLVTLLFDFINFTNVKYLFETPNLIITAILIIPALYLIHKGIETIGRTALLLFYISVGIFIFNDLALIGNVDINNLKPFLSDGILPVLKGALYYVIYTITPIIFLSIVPKSNDSYKKFNKYLFIGYSISVLSLVAIGFFVTSIYNYEFISLFNYPAYFTLKKIKYGFLANVENVLSFYFIIDYFFSILIFLYCIFYYLKKELNIKGEKLKITMLIITIILSLLANYIFKDTTLAILSSRTLFILYNLAFIILFFVIITIKIKRNKN